MEIPLYYVYITNLKIIDQINILYPKINTDIGINNFYIFTGFV